MTDSLHGNLATALNHAQGRRQVAVICLLIPVLAAACRSRSAASRTQPVRPSDSASIASCAAGALRLRGGRQGEEQMAHADVELTNVGTSPFRLGGAPTVTIWTAQGRRLPLTQTAPDPSGLDALVLSHGDTAGMVLIWGNWCGGPPGRLSVVVALPGAGGTVSGSFDGPPDGAYVPLCLTRAMPSTLQVIAAYLHSA